MNAVGERNSWLARTFAPPKLVCHLSKLTFAATFRRMKISIVVPAFNEERLLGDSLAQIKSAAKAFAPLGWDWEMIGCDNNSTDHTAEIARAAGARVVFEPINQIARARNSGAA